MGVISLRVGFENHKSDINFRGNKLISLEDTSDATRCMAVKYWEVCAVETPHATIYTAKKRKYEVV
jgi:hypothetical protein